MANELEKKVGPLPVWGWALGGLTAAYLWYRYYEDSSTSTSTTTGDTTATTSSDDAYGSQLTGDIDPSEAAANYGGSGYGTGYDSFTQFDDELQDFLAAQKELQSVTTALNASAPSSSSTTGTKMSTGKLLAKSAILAPFGHNKPAAPPGYIAVGTGSGNWQFVPKSLLPKGASSLVFSGTKPTAPAGEVAKGLGNGLWTFVKETAGTPKRGTPVRESTTKAKK